MKTTVNFSDFCDAFRKFDRDNNFSYAGKRALFDYLEEYEQSTGEEIELDVIALCCDYEENYFEDIAIDRDIEIDSTDEDERIEAVRKYLEQETTIVGQTSTSFIYAAF